MSDLTRRGFVKTSAGAAAGMTAIGALVSGQAEAHAHEAHTHAGGSHPVVAFVKDPRKGEISIMTGQREVRVRNRKLAAQIARAAR